MALCVAAVDKACFWSADLRTLSDRLYTTVSNYTAPATISSDMCNGIVTFNCQARGQKRRMEGMALGPLPVIRPRSGFS